MSKSEGCPAPNSANDDWEEEIERFFAALRKPAYPKIRVNINGKYVDLDDLDPKTTTSD